MAVEVQLTSVVTMICIQERALTTGLESDVLLSRSELVLPNTLCSYTHTVYLYLCIYIYTHEGVYINGHTYLHI